MKAAITLCLFSVFLALNNAAPQAKVRVKRALEQLEYGNHQNRPRVKKADPSVPQKLIPPNPIATKRLEEPKESVTEVKVENIEEKKPNVELKPKESAKEAKELDELYEWLMKSMKPETKSGWRKKRSSAVTAEDMSAAPVQARSKRSLYYDDLPLDFFENSNTFDGDDDNEYYDAYEYPALPEDPFFLDREDVFTPSSSLTYDSDWKRAAPYGLYDTVSEKRSREEAMNRLYDLAYRLGKKK